MSEPRRTLSDVLIETDRCPRCGHCDRDHRNNHCRTGCDCWIRGTEGRQAAALWNAYMGRY